MNNAIYEAAKDRDIRLLCHFTPSENFVRIATDPQGLLATKHLKNGKKAFNQTDTVRCDGFLGHVCCTVEYPNAWYFQKAKEKNPRLRDWVVLFIEHHYLWAVGTRFCPRNAAANFGQGVHEGIEAFEAMFADSVVGAYGKTYTRDVGHPAFLPTDMQAEVLIPDCVAREDLFGIGVLDKAQAKREADRLKERNAQIPRIWFNPVLFNAFWLHHMFCSGSRLKAKMYRGG